MVKERKKRSDEDTQEIKRGIAKRFNYVLEEMGETPSSLAKALNKTGSTNFYILSNPEKTNIPNLRLIIEILDYWPNLSRRWFLHGEGPAWIGEEMFSQPATDYDSFHCLLNELSKIIDKDKLDRWKIYERCFTRTFFHFESKIKQQHEQESLIEEFKALMIKGKK